MPRINGFARNHQNTSLPEQMHNKFLKLPLLAQAAFWGAIGYTAVMGLRAHNNEGFINDVVFVPIIEEILYRGILQPVIQKGQEVWNKYRGTKMDETSTRNRVLASSVLFGLSHSDPKSMVECAWNLGRGCGYLKEKTGSLFAPIAWHMKHNFIAESVLKKYVPQALFYPPLFYSMGKKIWPIPDFITKPIQTALTRLSGISR
jgi:membrane protease YdiL (CAAX protease family)